MGYLKTKYTKEQIESFQYGEIIEIPYVGQWRVVKIDTREEYLEKGLKNIARCHAESGGGGILYLRKPKGKVVHMARYYDSGNINEPTSMGQFGRNWEF